jgi:hypothetical protein
MFQFSRLPSRFLCIQNRIARHYSDRISPFGNPRIKTSVQLPWAFRRFRVLHRHLVPRHSSYTLLSLNFTRSFIECSMYASLNHYSIFKELFRRPLRLFGSAARGNDTSRGLPCQGSVKNFLRNLRLESAAPHIRVLSAGVVGIKTPSFSRALQAM